MRLNERGLELIKSFEGLKLKAYLCPAGVPTIGYGCTEGVKMGMTITLEQAESMLLAELEEFDAGVTKLVKVELTGDEHSALVAFAYNVGLGALKSSTLLKMLNAGDKAGAAEQFLRWNKAKGKVLAGLTRRRKAERALFLGE